MTSGDIMETLRAVRARVRFSRTVEMAVRWTLYASLLACVCLAASKFLPIAPQAAAAALVLPIAAAGAAAVRRITLRDCAILIDGSFRLDERVSTAVEVRGETPMECAVREDARRALASVDARSVGRVRWPRETRLLALAGALAGALALAPTPRSIAPSVSAELEAGVRREADRLQEAARDPRVSAHGPELQRILALLRSTDPERLREAVGALSALESEVGRRLTEERLSPETARALRELAERAAGAGAGIGRELAALGIEVELAGPADVDRRLQIAAGAVAAGRSQRPESGFDVPRLVTGAAVPVEARVAAERALRERGWASKYDDIVKQYYEEKP